MHLGEPSSRQDLLRTATRFSTSDTRVVCGAGLGRGARLHGTDWVENILLRPASPADATVVLARAPSDAR